MSKKRIEKILFSEKDKKVYFQNNNVSAINNNTENALIFNAKKLGSGGTGKVYKIPHGAYPIPIAIKRYSDKVLSENGAAIDSYLRSLIVFRKNMTDDIRRKIDKFTVWPQRLVYDYDTDEICGFTMHLIPEQFFTSINIAGEDEKKESNLDFVLHGAKFRKKYGLPLLSAKGRAKIVYDFLSTVSMLHNNDYILGDLSPKNLLIAVDKSNQSKNRILFIDTDSYRKRGSVHPLQQLHTPDWIPPECQKASVELSKLTPNANPSLLSRLKVDMFIQNQYTDVYKVCLAIIRLYHDGDHASIITSSYSADKKLRTNISDEFANYILQGLSDLPKARPSINDLLTSFVNSVNAKLKAPEISKLEAMIDIGDEEAMYNLGIAYARGNGVAIDKHKAQMLLYKAYLRGNIEAIFALVDLFDNPPEHFINEAVKHGYVGAK
ncbi:MAG: hypothetical protein LBC71_04990 [Oscillospiraceae bacterium]|jgi:serine/threonine protein kinase|nr:hypothetical protein [Oscillospiraceae bacterium]